MAVNSPERCSDVTLERGRLRLTVQGTRVDLAYLHRQGKKPPLICLHGFGSSKEDYADLALWEEFDDHGLWLFDAPGFGGSTVAQPDALSILFLMQTALSALDALGLERFHLAGHSMGGLTALKLAGAIPERVLSFSNIEGNLAPEDCFLSRQIINHPAPNAEAFLDGFIDRVRQREEFSTQLYLAGLRAKVQATSIEPVFRSMVEISDNDPLVNEIASLSCPRQFIYGAQNRHLSYLGKLPTVGVATVEVPHSGHFPMYSNPPALWHTMTTLILQAR